MPETISIFISYSHADAAYLEADALFGFLKGLEKNALTFWTDREIRPGEPWDRVIKTQIQRADIALVLVSQGFLDSDYCQNVEIRDFLAQKTHVFPVILSPCDWHRHDWLKSRQFLPDGEQTLEEHYQDKGKRTRLFLEIREQLRVRADLIRKQRPVSIQPIVSFSGKAKIAFCDHLGDDRRRLADYLEIVPGDQARFDRGDEGRGIWVWLEQRRHLANLPEALAAVRRADLVKLLTDNH